MSQNGKSNLNQDVSDFIVTENDTESDLPILPDLTIKNINLPDVPLLLVIQNVPLYSLIIDLPLVHSRFSKFCKIVLQHNHRLVLYIGDLEQTQKLKCSFRMGIPFINYLVDADGKHRSYDPEFYRLHYLTLNDKTVDKMVTLMPAISHLEIVISEVNIYLISQLIRLLTHWATTLKWLKFCCGNFQHEDSQHIFTLIREINSKLSLLEHLTLNLDGYLFVDKNFKSVLFPHRSEIAPQILDWPILRHLKEFFIQTRNGYYLKSLFGTLERQAGDQLTAIGFGLPFAWNHYLGKLEKHPLAARFTLLASRNEPPYELPLMPNLTGYTAHWHLNEALNSVTSRLVSLGHLQYLQLRRLPPSNGNVSANQGELSTVPSVEILRIHFNNSSFPANQDHTVLQDANWASLFPSVQIVNLIHSGDFCAKCYPEEGGNYRNNLLGFEQASERMSCFSQLLAPLTVLPSLRKIFYQRNNDLKNIAEFFGNGAFVKTHAYIF